MVFQTEVIIIGCTKNSIAIRAFQEDPSLFPLFTDLLLAIALFLLLLILLAGCDKWRVNASVQYIATYC